MLCLKCKGQHMAIDVCEKVASNFINANVVHFDFCERWDGTVKTAQFTQRIVDEDDGEKKFVTYSVLIDELAGTAAMPNEVVEGELGISAFGVDPETGMRITSTIVTIKVEKSGYIEDGETPIPPTPDLYTQFVAKVHAAAGVPAIGDNGNWIIGGEDTGIRADWSAEQDNAASSAAAAKAAATNAENAARSAAAAAESAAAAVSAPPIVESKSGALVSIADGAAFPAVSLISRIEPVQEGEGDPSPDNVRAISGWNAAVLKRCGVNLFDKSQIVIGEYVDGEGLSVPNNSWGTTGAIPIVGGRTVTYGGITDAGNLPASVWLDADLQCISSFKQASGINTVFAPQNARYLKMSIRYTTDANTLMVANGGMVPEAYTPYQETKIQTDLPETVYIGKWDSGKGVVNDYGLLSVLTGEESFLQNTTDGYYYGLAGIDVDTVAACSHLIPNAETQGGIVVANGQLRFYIMQEFSTLAKWKDYLADQYAAGNPVQVLLKNKTARAIQTTPQQMDMLKGVNNVWSDTGDTDLSYIADTKLYIDERIAAIAAAVAEG